MIEMPSESEDKKPLRCRKTSPGMEEIPCEGISFGAVLLKKGPWTAAEDAILVQYVTKHGEGNWNAVQKHSGLSRCGKSCRLRWANHLRPDLKKGAFTQEEEALIIERHAKMGNKWARMAVELPGRTDNEIKNFWNTRIKKLQRAGLPIYPPEMQVQPFNESEQSDDMISGNGDIHHSDLSQTNTFDIPEIGFKGLELNQALVNYSPSLLNVPSSSSLFGYTFPGINPQKRLREIETDGFARFSSVQPIWSTYSYDPDLNASHNNLIDGYNSSSEPDSKAVKYELPSLQYSASQVGGGGPLPSLDNVDTLIQSPLNEQTHSNCPSPLHSGLLEAIVYESWNLKHSNQLTGDGVESSSYGGGIKKKSDNFGDPISPLCQSAASDFVEFTPGTGGSSSDDPQSDETAHEFSLKPEPVDWPSIESNENDDISCPLECPRPDELLDSFWFGSRISGSKEQLITADVGAFFDEDLSYGYNQSFDHGSSLWDKISDSYAFFSSG